MKQKKVVLVDDEDDIALFLQTALEDNGYIAMTASSVPEGLDLIRREMPDLICIDILMPEESGVSLYQKLKGDPGLKRIPVIFMSGLSMSGELKNIEYLKLSDGTVLPEPEGFIEKPVDVDRFLERVNVILRCNNDG